MSPSHSREPRRAVRLLLFGGIALIIGGMLLGESYAIFVSHVANGEVRQKWVAAVAAVAHRDPAAVAPSFARIEELQELRGRIMDTHSHISAYGMLALALALLVPAMAIPERRKLLLAAMILAGGLVHSLFVFVRLYGWRESSVLADAGGLLLLAGCTGFFAAFVLKGVGKLPDVHQLMASPSPRVFLRGGALLILLGMCFGFYYAWIFVTQHEPGQYRLFTSSLEQASAGQAAQAQTDILAYRGLQSKIAITAAAHSHVIEYGMVAILLGFLQPFVLLNECWKRRWAWTFVLASLFMGVCIFLAPVLGLVSAGVADTCGLFLLLALFANLIGSIRWTGAEDAPYAQGENA